MVDDTIKTGVDDLLNLLKKHEKLSLQEAAAQLNMPAKTLEKWVDFLVEERVISVEYKFTQPYIYLNRAKKKEESKKTKSNSAKNLKKSFFERAKKKQLSKEQVEQLWKRKVEIELERHKDYFYRSANIKDLNHIPELWNKFCKKIKGEL